MTPVNCNECGHELEVGPSTNFVTCGRCSARLAVRRTGTSTWTERVANPGDPRITDGPRPPAPQVDAPPPLEDDRVTQARLAELEREARIARIDREWEAEREKYMITGRYGYRHVPTPGASLFGGVIICAFGLVWTAFAFNMTRNSPFGEIDLLFPCFGVLFVLFGAGMSIYSYSKAQDYQRAHAQYQARRRAAERDEK